MDPEADNERRRRPMLAIGFGVLIGAAGMAAFDRAVLSDADEPKVVDIMCMPVMYANGGPAPLGVIFRVYDNGYAYKDLLLEPADEPGRTGESEGFKYDIDVCIP